MHASMPCPKQTLRRLRGYSPESQERVKVGNADEEALPPRGTLPPPSSTRVHSSTTVTETKEFHVPPYFEQRTMWEWITVHHTKSNLECFEAEGQVGQRKASNGKCVPVTLLMPVY